MNCKEAKLLIMPYLGNDKDITGKEHRAFEQHLQSCARCAKEYEESQSLVSLIRKYRPLIENVPALIEERHPPANLYMTVEEGWRDLCRRCPDLAEDPKRQKYLRLFYKISAAAACLLIGISAWLMFSPDSKPEIKQKVISQQGAFDSFLTVELVSDNSKTTIPPGQKLETSANELKTLIIDNKHQIVMNADTVLTIRPLNVDKNYGCTVELASGQLYSQVKRNANPFIVKTSNGKAAITGTTFDISVADDSTTLVVSEGSVRFESKKGVVRVATGQISRIVGQSAPTKPRACNTAEITAWATSNQVEILPTKPDLHTTHSKHDHPGLLIISGPIDLEAIDYEGWVAEKRDWFNSEFPWIFQLEEALVKEGIDVDYPQLLMQSGYIWQFVYPESSAKRVAFLDFKLLLEAVLPYGLDRRWLFKNVPAAKYAIRIRKNTKDKFTSLKEFEQWTASFEGAPESPEEPDSSIISRSLQAGTYLVNTRTLLWLGIKNGISLDEFEDEEKLLSLLNQEIQAADRCIQTAIAQSETTCPTKDDPLRARMIKEINVISESERAISELR
ncbi:MAG: FecR domain-containing protein [Planctomycetota bacterium]